MGFLLASPVQQRHLGAIAVSASLATAYPVVPRPRAQRGGLHRG